MNTANPQKNHSLKNQVIKSGSIFSDVFGISKLWSFIASGFILAVIAASAWWFAFSTPARRIVVATGPENSTFARSAEKYRPGIEGKKDDPAHPVTGVTLELRTTQGSQDNLDTLRNPASKVDVGFVLSRVALASEPAGPKGDPEAERKAKEWRDKKASDEAKNAGLVSLGCVAYQPLFIFYRSETPLHLLSDFSGKRLSIGAPGGAANTMATTLLDANGVTPKTATITTEPSAEAAKALLAGGTDAVFLMGESAPIDALRMLLRAPGVRLFSFEQADAYARKFTGLNKLKMPQGGIDLGRNIPAQDVWLIGPTVQLVARKKFDAALCALVLDGAKEAHGNATLLQNKDEFPAPIGQDFKLGNAAENYYKTGKSLLYRHLPFWLATIAYQIGLVFLPAMAILISGLRGLYGTYKLSIQFRINRWYRILHKIERERLTGMTPQKKEEILSQIDYIKKNVRQMKVPASFVSQFYGLRQHIEYVANILDRTGQDPADADTAA